MRVCGTLVVNEIVGQCLTSKPSYWLSLCCKYSLSQNLVACLFFNSFRVHTELTNTYMYAVEKCGDEKDRV